MHTQEQDDKGCDAVVGAANVQSVSFPVMKPLVINEHLKKFTSFGYQIANGMVSVACRFNKKDIHHTKIARNIELLIPHEISPDPASCNEDSVF